MTDKPDTSPDTLARACKSLRGMWMGPYADMLETLAARVVELEGMQETLACAGNAAQEISAEWRDRAEAAEAKLAAFEAQVERLRDAADAVCRQDGKGEYPGRYQQLRQRIFELRAALQGDKP